MNNALLPSLEEFLAAPIEEVAKVAPATMVYAPGGTRRHAVFEGIEPWSEEYMRWALTHTITACALIFDHGIRHLFTPLVISTNFQEVNRHREALFRSLDGFMTSDKILLDYRHLGWRVRLIGAEHVPDLVETAEKLNKYTLSESSRTLYWLVVPNSDCPWTQLVATAQEVHAKTRCELIRAMYGDDIPLASLYLAFGKPMISPEIVPPLLMGQLQCYWSQQPGYMLTEKQFRTILYDYAFLRSTWQEEKLERAKEALAHQSAWEQGPMLGLGMRLGPFWYPAPMASPAWPKPV